MGRSRKRTEMGSATRARRTVHLMLRDGLTCWICGRPFNLDDRPTLEHVIPRNRGGANDLDNLRLTHRRCNKRRGAEWGEFSAEVNK